MRHIATNGFKVTPATDLGPAPMLQWIAITDLVVDESYQRELGASGRKNIARIAERFRWSCFAPVVVAPVEGGLFAIVDGQHRTTAAALVGIEKVPCQVIVADRENQAEAFVAINGAVTKMSRMQIHAAAVAAGRADALLLEEACKTGGVRLLKSPRALAEQKPGDTMAVQACAACFGRYGRDTFITALQCVTQTENNVVGILSHAMIHALCAVMDRQRVWRDAGERLLQAFDKIDLAELDGQARQRAAGSSGRVSVSVALSEGIERALSKLMAS